MSLAAWSEAPPTGGADARLDPELQGILKRAVHGRGGIVRRIVEVPPCPRTGLFVAAAQFPRPDYFRRNEPTAARCVDSSSGAGFTRSDALWATVGEAIERYCGSIYGPDELVWASSRQLGPLPMDLAPLIQVGRPEVVWPDPDAPRGWLPGLALQTGEAVWVPAQMSVLAYQFRDPREVLQQSDSTGLACGRDLASAALGGLCEALERDAFAAAWLLDAAPPRVRLSDRARGALRPGPRHALALLESEITLLSLGSRYGAHVMVCVLEPGGLGCGVVGAAASTSPLRAIEKALTEALHGWSAAGPLRAGRDPAAIDALEDAFDHLLFYLQPDRFAVVRRMTRGTQTVCIDSPTGAGTGRHPTADGPAGSLSTLVAALAEDGLAPCLVDLTTADVRELGLRVVKVIVPGLQPLVFGPACSQVPDRRRLAMWARHWGCDEERLNPHPHPFP